MPQKAWSDKRERQYEHIKDSYEDRGVSTDEAEERAARTVNKERAGYCGASKAEPLSVDWKAKGAVAEPPGGSRVVA